jgi:3'(2'), 5'-bisphosphate nucleotidase
MKFSQEQLLTLCNIAHAAGQEIMSVFNKGGAVWQKEDASPLTEADLRADAVIRKGLTAAFSGVFILSEESRSAGEEPTDTFFLVDPLDGTKEFLKRNNEFTVNIALVHLGKPVAGVVLAPALAQIYYAAHGHGAYMRNKGEVHKLAVANYKPVDALRVVGSRSHDADTLRAWLAKLNHAYTFEPIGSSLKFCHIAAGRADIYPRFGPTCQWDTAAAQCVLEVADGRVIDLTGVPLSYGLDKSNINPNFIAMGGLSEKIVKSFSAHATK